MKYITFIWILMAVSTAVLLFGPPQIRKLKCKEVLIIGNYITGCIAEEVK